MAVVVSGLLLVAAAGPAQAHNGLVSSDPADGATVAVAPDHVTLTFTEPAIALGTQVRVVSPAGVAVGVGDPVLTDTSVTQALDGDLPAGAYTVTWRVTSADGHPVEGALTFTAQGAAALGSAAVPVPGPTPTPTPAPEPGATTSDEPSPALTASAPGAGTEPDGSGGSPVPFLLGAVVLGGAAGAAGTYLRRRRTGD